MRPTNRYYQWAAALWVAAGLSASVGSAALIASDSFLSGSGYYPGGNLFGNANMEGTEGYSGGWTHNTSAVVVNGASAMGHPLVVNSPASNQGGLYLPGVGSSNGTRSQTRVLAAYDTSAPNYYFSGLMSSSEVFATGTGLFGLSNAVPTSQLPSVGLQVGFTSGGLISLFYRNASGTYSNSTILNGYLPGETYLFVVSLETAGNTVAVSLYDSAGTIVESLSGIQTETTISTDLARVAAAVTGDFDGGIPSTIRFDEFRFGTELSDVFVPEPSSLFLGLMGGLGLLRRRR